MENVRQYFTKRKTKREKKILCKKMLYKRTTGRIIME